MSNNLMFKFHLVYILMNVALLEKYFLENYILSRNMQH